MLLHTIEIKNYRSLEHVTLDNLQHFNVLIGRNNAGKSSVFLALSQLGLVLQGQSLPPEVLTDRDPGRSVEIQLIFKPNSQERETFISLLIPADLHGNRRQMITKSPFFRMVGNWVTIHQMIGDEHTANPPHKFVNLSTVSKDAEVALSSSSLDITKASQHYTANLAAQQLATDNPVDPPRTWLYNCLYHYFSSAYYFNPFRHSEPIVPVQLTYTLAQNGSNLAQVLNSIITNDRDTFDEIERFVHGALPDVGRLQPRLINNNQTQVVFRVPQGNYSIPLTDMGGGIEQLLMVATVLLTTNAENTIFVEEPESHLHAGAQRYLLEKLYV